MEQTLHVLLIEDNDDDVELILRELKRANGFTIIHEVAHKEDEIRRALTQKTWDLIICDYFLGGFDAPRVLTMLDVLGIDIPFILVSGSADPDLVASSLRITGVHEYVNKNALSRIAPVIHRELRLYSGYDEMIRSWAYALEIRDHETRGHSERVTSMTVRLAQWMGIAQSEIVHIRRGAILHDVGKIGIPDSILLKPGPLTPEEMEKMRGHPVIAYEMLRHVGFLKRSLDIPLYHHERWDGTGYPYKLKEKEIPLPARIFSVVDVHDAITSTRPYRTAMDEVDAFTYIEAESGRSFDPHVVEVYLRMVRNGS